MLHPALGPLGNGVTLVPLLPIEPLVMPEPPALPDAPEPRLPVVELPDMAPVPAEDPEPVFRPLVAVPVEAPDEMPPLAAPDETALLDPLPEVEELEPEPCVELGALGPEVPHA